MIKKSSLDTVSLYPTLCFDGNCLAGTSSTRPPVKWTNSILIYILNMPISVCCTLIQFQPITKSFPQEIKTWLWMFSVCHFIVVLHPSQSFDVEYIRLFRTTQQLLHHFAPKIKELYPDTELLATARIYRPRLLFVFQSNSASMHLPPKKGVLFFR